MQICPKVGKVLNGLRLLQNTNLMWKSAQHKEKVDLFSKGFFFDSWVPSFLLVYPELMVLYERKISSERPTVIPLYK